MPKVSIVIPCYNAERYIGRTLESLRAQTLRDWECIVVDDGSTDQSAVVVNACLGSDARISLLCQPNAGVCRARNAGYAACSPDSRYLLFLDADDCLEPSMIETLVGQLDQNPDVALAYCAFECVDELDRPIQARDARFVESVRYVPGRFGVRTLPPCTRKTPFVSIFGVWAGLLPSNSLLRRSVYAATPGWDEALGQLSEDTDLFLHVALRAEVHYIPRQLVRWRRHAAQSTRNAARIVAQDAKLYRKWAQVSDFAPHEQAVIADARRFRQARLMPVLWLKYGSSHLRHGNLVEAAKCFLRAVKQMSTGIGMLIVQVRR